MHFPSLFKKEKKNLKLTHSLTPPALPNPQVMIATTGAQLLPPDAVRVLRDRLLPRATVLTPNLPEARLLLSGSGAEPGDVECVDDLERIARALRALGPRWVLVKGGHCPFRRADGKVARDAAEREVVVDVLVGGDGDGEEEVVLRVETAYCDSRNTHGTGCSLACELEFLPP